MQKVVYALAYIIFFLYLCSVYCKYMKMQKLIYGLCCTIVVMGLMASCKKHTYDFTYSPNAPKAGARVLFTNTSDAGENWVWKFGDGSQSTLKSPSHIYTAAGTYVVELMADSNKTRTMKHVVEVLDSIPSIYVASDTVQQYSSIVLKAAFYNPSKASVTYDWSIDEQLFTITQGSLTSDSIVGYFSDYGKSTTVKLNITIGSKTTVAERTLVLTDKEAPSLLLQTQQGELYRQRIYNNIYEAVKPFDGDEALILDANDSTATLNGVTYDIHNMPVLTDKQVNALQVDLINRKLYVILDDGLYVANANGDALAQIVNTPAATLLVDSKRNSLYWSDAFGVWAMPLVTHPQNILSEQTLNRIHNVNEVGGVSRMIILEN